MNCYSDWASLWSLHTACVTKTIKFHGYEHHWMKEEVWQTHAAEVCEVVQHKSVLCNHHTQHTKFKHKCNWMYATQCFGCCFILCTKMGTYVAQAIIAHVKSLQAHDCMYPCKCILFSCPMHSFAVLLFAYCRVHARMYFVNNAKPHVDYLHGIYHPIVCVVQYHSGRLWQSSQTNFHETYTLCIVVWKQKVMLIPHLP